MSKFIEKTKQKAKEEIGPQETTVKIFTVNEISIKLKKINDFHSLQNVIEQLVNQLPYVLHDKITFVKFARRLIQAVIFQLQYLPHDSSEAKNSIKILKSVKKNWKIMLHDHYSGLISKKAIKNQIFFSTLNKNEYFYYLFKGYNTLLQKQVFRMIKDNYLNIRSIFYLKNNNISNYWQRIHQKMISVAKDHQNQTYLKIQLIVQFIKHTLLQVNFCISSHEFDELFSRIIQLALYGFRLIKKFYSQQIFKHIKQFKLILVKALSMYRVICISSPNKLIYLTNLLNLLQNKKTKRKKSILLAEKRKQSKENINQIILNQTNPKAFAIKLAFRLLDSWKKVQSKKAKQSLYKKKIQYEKNESLSKIRKITNEKDKKQQLLENLHQQQLALKNKMKRSISLNYLKSSQIETINKIRIRKQIEDQFDKQFGRLNYLKSSERQNKQYFQNKSSLSKGRSQRSFKLISSQLKRRSNSFKNVLGMSINNKRINQTEHNQTQLKIQEYRQKLNMFSNQKNFSSKNRNLYHVDKRKSVSNFGNISSNSLQKSRQTNNTILGLNQPKMKLKL